MVSRSICVNLAGDLLHGADVPLLLQPQRHDVHLVTDPAAAATGPAAADSPPQAALDAALLAAQQVDAVVAPEPQRSCVMLP